MRLWSSDVDGLGSHLLCLFLFLLKIVLTCTKCPGSSAVQLPSTSTRTVPQLLFHCCLQLFHHFPVTLFLLVWFGLEQYLWLGEGRFKAFLRSPPLSSSSSYFFKTAEELAPVLAATGCAILDDCDAFPLACSSRRSPHHGVCGTGLQ